MTEMASPKNTNPTPDRSMESGGSAPVIQIQGGHSGEDNQAFTLEDEGVNGASSRAGSHRRASYDPSTTSLLTVPSRAPRRHSLAMSSSSEYTLPEVDTDGPAPHVSNTHRASTITIDYLTMPRLHPPRPHSPGATSVQSYWSELVRLKDRRDSTDSFASQASVASYQSKHSGQSLSALSSAVSERIINLVQKFSNRTEYFKEMTVQPLTPSTDGSHSAMSMEVKPRQRRLASFIPVQSRNSTSTISDMTDNDGGIFMGEDNRCCKIRCRMPRFIRRMDPRRTIDPSSMIYALWLMLVTLAYSYNAAAIPLRGFFVRAEYYHKQEVVTYDTREVCESSNHTEGSTVVYCYNKTTPLVTYITRYRDGVETPENRYYWWLCDYLADLIYLLDILLVKVRIRFVKNGLVEKNRSECLRKYITSRRCKMDFASLIPLDLMYFIRAINYNSMVRLPRLLKIQTFWEFYDRVDQSVTNPHIIRVMRTLTYMLFLIHIESCGYFIMSAYEGLGFNQWVYSGDGIAYVRCMYLATKTATSIGNNPRPQNQLEYSFMTVYWLSGVFVFAMLIGQIRDIFQAANAAKTQYRETMDKTLGYITNMHIPKEMRDKVRMWFNYNWEHQKTLNENLLLEALPRKMKADLAIQVHFEMLNKVQLFQECEKMLLFDLVLKLNPVLYLPGDDICVKGEVGTEMYIVMSGQVEVVGGENNDIVFATLYEGSVFGEISLLAVGGGNRRTANVRSKGYSQLFILSKVDFEEAMACYPDAQKILKKKAKKLLNNNKKMEAAKNVEAQEVIRSREGTPKMLKTVIKVIDPESKIHNYFKTNRNSTQKNPDQSKREEQFLSDEEENDEVLVVEQIERPLSDAELQRYSNREKRAVNPGENQMRQGNTNELRQGNTNHILGSPNPSYNSTDEKIEEILNVTPPQGHVDHRAPVDGKSTPYPPVKQPNTSGQSTELATTDHKATVVTENEQRLAKRFRKIGHSRVAPETNRPTSALDRVQHASSEQNNKQPALTVLNPSLLFTVDGQDLGEAAEPRGNTTKKEHTKRSLSAGLPNLRTNKVGIKEHQNVETGISVNQGTALANGMCVKTVGNEGCSVFNASSTQNDLTMNSGQNARLTTSTTDSRNGYDIEDTEAASVYHIGQDNLSFEL